MRELRNPIDRREFLKAGAAVTGLLSSPGLLLALPGCGGSPRELRADPSRFAEAYREAVRIAERAGPARDIRLVADVGEVDVAGRLIRTFLYDGRMPGPEIRVRAGERLRVTLETRLPDETTIHWHGVPLPFAMDGVPHVTQAPVPPGGTFVYDFIAEPSGTYLYHSHVGLQLDTGLLAPLIFEEPSPHVAYDREYTLLFQDLLPGEPEMPARGRGMGMMGRMEDHGPDYLAVLVNGKPPEDPALFEIGRGDRLRLRLANPSSSHTYRVAIGGHSMTVTHADGRPVRPVEVDALELGQGERYDVIVEGWNPGTWNIAADPVTGGPPAGRGLLRYRGSAGRVPPAGERRTSPRQSRLLTLEDLVSLETTGEPVPAPDRTFHLTLRHGMMMMAGGWNIDGQRYPDADPLPIRQGERVRVRMTNMSMRLHPMHLHGHFFRVGNVIKETVMVPPRMGRRTFDFTADNPGDWFFHCHNLYHMESGMARVFQYRSRTARPGPMSGHTVEQRWGEPSGSTICASQEGTRCGESERWPASGACQGSGS
jgi:multicopper oxidase